MADFPSAKTNSGVELPLMSLKGKAYMLVAHRILWLNEDVKRFTISTDFPLLNDDQAVARATVNVYNDDGILVKSSTATKRETKKEFPDFTEKAETGAIGRAVTLLGFGTAFALADLAEGDRIIDAPLSGPKVKEPVIVYTAAEAGKVAAQKEEVKAVSVRTSQPEVSGILTTTENTEALTVTADTQIPGPKRTSFRKPAKKTEAAPQAGGWD